MATPMELCILKFALPINLCLPSDRVFFFEDSGRLVAIQSDAKHGKKIFHYDKEFTSWVEDGLAGLDSHAGDDQEKTPALRFKIDQWVADFRGGFIEEVDYTVLNLMFENDTDDFMKNVPAHMDWASAVIRRFMDSYRLVTNRAWLGSGGLPYPSIVIAANSKNYEFKPGLVKASVQSQIVLHMAVGNPIYRGRHLNAVPEAELNSIDAWLKQGVDIHLYDLLMMDAAVQVWQHQAHDLAIILTESAFEVYCQQLLLNYCKRKRIATLPNRQKGSSGYKIAIEYGNIQEDLFRFVEWLSKPKVGIKATSEYAAWKRDVYDKRNAIAHRGKRGSTKNEAVTANDSANALKTVLRGLLP